MDHLKYGPCGQCGSTFVEPIPGSDLARCRECEDVVPPQALIDWSRYEESVTDLTDTEVARTRANLDQMAATLEDGRTGRISEDEVTRRLAAYTKSNDEEPS